MQRNFLAAVLVAVLLAGCATGASSELKRGWELMLNEDYAGAVTHYEKVLEQYPDNPYALLNLGVAYQRLGEFERARPNYEAAIVHGKSASVTRVAEASGVKPDTTTVSDLARQNLATLPN